MVASADGPATVSAGVPYRNIYLLDAKPVFEYFEM